jgi:trans-aconitate 2-methyltransferase
MDPKPRVNWDAETYDRSMGFVSRLGAGVLEWLNPQAGERILDFGCGTGDLAAQIAKSGAEVVGLDISPEMVEQARRKYPDLTFKVGDATQVRFAEPFDAVFSNAALHWMRDAAGAAAAISAALKPGGRLAAEFGGAGNVESIVRAARDTAAAAGRADAFAMPWYYPTVGEYASLLEQHGLETRMALLFDRPTRLERGEQGLIEWLEMFGSGMFPFASESEKRSWFEEIAARLRSSRYKEGCWVVDYRRIRICAVKTSR